MTLVVTGVYASNNLPALAGKSLSSHGTTDRVLPIDRCSRRLVPALERSAYPVRYYEFEGPHTIPPAIVHEAVDWLLGVQPWADRQPGVQS